MTTDQPDRTDAHRVDKHTVERAFELAKSGTCRSVEDIRRQLTREQYLGVDAHLSGSTLKKQLVEAIKAARAN